MDDAYNSFVAGWVVGLFDGRGCMFVHKGNPPYPGLSIKSGDLDVLTRFYNIIGTGSIRGPRIEKGKPNWTWSVSGRKSYPIIKQFFLSLGSRQRTNALRVFGSDALGVMTGEWYPGLELTHKQKGDRIEVLT